MRRLATSFALLLAAVPAPALAASNFCAALGQIRKAAFDKPAFTSVAKSPATAISPGKLLLDGFNRCQVTREYGTDSYSCAILVPSSEADAIKRMDTIKAQIQACVPWAVPYDPGSGGARRTNFMVSESNKMTEVMVVYEYPKFNDKRSVSLIVRAKPKTP